MGFLERRQRGRGLSLNQIIGVFAMIASILLFGSMLASSRPHLGVGQQLLPVAMVATSYCIAVVCAVYPKYYWQMARRDPDGELPTASYLLWGTAAALLFSSLTSASTWKGLWPMCSSAIRGRYLLAPPPR